MFDGDAPAEPVETDMHVVPGTCVTGSLQRSERGSRAHMWRRLERLARGDRGPRKGSRR
jgi:hypothetical protein